MQGLTEAGSNLSSSLMGLRAASRRVAAAARPQTGPESAGPAPGPGRGPDLAEGIVSLLRARRAVETSAGVAARIDQLHESLIDILA